MNDKRISVVIVDDHTLFRTGLHELLTHRELDVIGMTGVSTEAAQLVAEKQPDIVLLDLRMRELSGIEVLEQIHQSQPEQCVVILTTSIAESDLLRALELGAAGYLLKDMEPDTFVKSLHQALNGEIVVAPDLTSLLAKAAVSKTKPVEVDKPPVYGLTPREMDILRHIAMGESNKDIARSLGIVDGTVKLHVRAVLKKLGVNTRVQAAVLAVQEKLCE
jgi:two-component system nitrate/nitrite response regulator NarL